MLHEMSQSRSTDTAGFYLYDKSEIVRVIEAENTAVAAGGWRVEEMESFCLMGIKFQLCKINHSQLSAVLQS